MSLGSILLFTGSREARFYGVIVLVGVVVLLATVKWIHRDAKKHGMGSPWLLVICVGLLFLLDILAGVLGVVVYLLARSGAIRSDLEQ